MNKTLTNNTGNLILELHQDSMSAWLTVKKSKHLIDEMDILALIKTAGIKTGFEEAMEYIRANSLEKDFDIPFPIAICKTGSGESVLRYHFDPDMIAAPSDVLSYNDLLRLSFIGQESVVAEYTNNLFEQGGSIYDIFGELINPGIIDSEKAETLAGKNVRYDSSIGCYHATTDGYPYLDQDGCICVSTELKLSAHDLPSELVLNPQTPTTIVGDVAHTHITCSKALQITGDVSECILTCADNLTVGGSILHCNSQPIIVFGELRCAGAHASKILVQRQLGFNDSITDCVVACDGDILGGENSLIVGGNVQAGGSISISRAGNEQGTQTELEISISPFFRSLLMHQTKELIKLKSSTEAPQEQISDLQNQIKQCEEKLDANLSAFLNRAHEEQKKISITCDVYPPLNIRILKHCYQYSDHHANLEIIEKDQ